jgi:hypothetical protein
MKAPAVAGAFVLSTIPPIKMKWLEINRIEKYA